MGEIQSELLPVPQQGLERGASSAANGNSRAVAQHDFVAVQSCTQLAHAVELDDCRPVDADEAAWVEPSFEGGKGLAQEVALGAQMQAGIVVVGADPIDLGNRDHQVGRGSGDDEALNAIFLTLRALSRQQGSEPPGTLNSLLHLQPLTHPAQRGIKTLDVERLHQIIERMRFERAHRELIVRGYEYDGGDSLDTASAKDFESVHLRHSHVEKEEIGRQRVESAQCLGTIAAFACHDHVGVRCEKLADAATRQRFIVRYQDTFFRRITNHAKDRSQPHDTGAARWRQLLGRPLHW